MKTAVVFYTRDGSTRLAAQVLASGYDADLFELEEVKKRGKSVGGFIAAGFGASFGLRSRLKNSFVDEMKAYDMICIGSPVWAGKTVPAVNAFIHSLADSASGKKIVIFTVQADEAPEKKPTVSLEAHKKALANRGAEVIRMLRLHGAPPGKTVFKQEIEKQIGPEQSK